MGQDTIYTSNLKTLAGTVSTTLANSFGGTGVVVGADGNGALYSLNSVAPAYNSILTFANTNVAAVFTPVLAGGSNIVTAPALGAVNTALTVTGAATTAWQGSTDCYSLTL